MDVGKLFRLLHTLRYLHPVQFYGRVWFRLYRGSSDNRAAPPQRAQGVSWQAPCAGPSSMLDAAVFRFLNVTAHLYNVQSWNDPSRDKLWLYNLHYFDDLNAVDARWRAAWHRALIARWIEENPPAEGNGWEPYPTSLRIVNWVKWALAGNPLAAPELQSLAVQARWLRKRLERHLLGNHLFANAKALVFAGLFFEGEEANRWLQTGLRILKREVPEQVLPDGGHFERSPMYHAMILEDVLDLINLAQAHVDQVPEAQVSGWRECAARMLHWLNGMVHPDGEVAFFNDTAMGIAPRLDVLCAYSARLGIRHISSTTTAGLLSLASSGYVRIEQRSAVAFLDVAPIGPDYLPGHAHADTLSFELSLYGKRVIVNSGTSVYGYGEERQRQRSTAAHNTVVIDDQNSSEVWAGFRVARRAYPSQPNIFQHESRVVVEASHNGYKRLPGKNIHHRKWEFAGNSLVIHDLIIGGFGQAVAYFHLHPDIEIDVQNPVDKELRLKLGSGQPVNLEFSGDQSVELKGSTWHPKFGVSIENICILVPFTRHELTTRIAW